MSSKEGVSRILKLKGVSNGRKPLSLLCRDLATIQEYALGIDKTKYKMLRSYQPGRNPNPKPSNPILNPEPDSGPTCPARTPSS